MSSRSASQPVLTPGAIPAAETEEVAQAPAASQDAMADVIKAMQAEIAALKAAAAASDAAKLPQVVYEPQTPHGIARLAESATAHMTVAEVMAAISDKRMPEPETNYLCKDGYYVRRPRSQ
jgi:hypothetical protein